MLEMLVRGNVEGGGLLWVLLVQLPSLAHGCRLMEGLGGVSGTVGYLGEHRLSFFLCQTVFQLFSLCSIVKTNYIVVAGG